MPALLVDHRPTAPRRMLLVSLLALLPWIAVAANDAVRDALFTAAETARAQAVAAQAEALAPQAWQQGTQAFQRAENDFARGRDLERIRRDLETARSQFSAAAESAAALREPLAPVLEARALAERAQAPRLFPSQWQQAEDQLRAAAGNLERGRESQAQPQIEAALGRYREVELIAIEGQLLSRARAEIAEAQRERVDRHAPRTLAQAQAWLAQAERQLAEDRYRTEAPRQLADAAAREARHARYLAQRIQAATARGGSVEDLLLEYIQPLGRVAEAAGVDAPMDAGPHTAGDAVIVAIERLHVQARDAHRQAEEARQRAQNMDDEIRELDARLGQFARERTALVQDIEVREQRQRQLQRLETLFAPEEAVVLRQGDLVILRLVGLDFPSGDARVTEASLALLDKVGEAANLFPQARLRIEGHTDSVGSIQLNRDLSQRRAESVREYLVERHGLPTHRLDAEGYGPDRPVATNDTPEGRALNRRIDISFRIG